MKLFIASVIGLCVGCSLVGPVEVGQCYWVSGDIVEIVAVKEFGAIYKVCGDSTCSAGYASFNVLREFNRADCP